MGTATRTARRLYGTYLPLAAISGIVVAAYGSYPALLLLGATVVLAATLIAAIRWGFSSLLFAAMAGAVFTAPMNQLRLGNLATVSDLLFLMAAVLLAVSRLSAPAPTYLRPFQPLVIAAAAVIMGGLLGTFFSTSAITSLIELTNFTLATVGLFVLVAIWAPDRRQLRALAWLFTSGAAISAVLGMTLIQDTWGRAQGLTLHANHLGMTSLMASGVALGLALTSRRTPRMLAAALCTLLVAAVLLSGSRAALAGGVAFFFVYLLATRNWRVLRWAGLASIGCALLLAVGTIEVPNTNALGRVLGADPTAAESDSARARLRADTLERIDAHPFTGEGFVRARSGHNLYLQLWASAGLLGLAGFFVLVMVVVRMMVSRPRPDPLVMAMLAAYVGYLVAAYGSTVYWDRYVWVHLVLAVGLIVAGREALQERGALIIPPVATARRARLQADSPVGAFRTTQ